MVVRNATDGMRLGSQLWRTTLAALTVRGTAILASSHAFLMTFGGIFPDALPSRPAEPRNEGRRHCRASQSGLQVPQDGR